MALLHFLRPLPATLAVFLLFLAAAASAGQFLDTNPADFLAGTFSNTSVEGTGDEANVTLGGEFAANGSEQVGYWKFNENNATPFDQSGLLGWWKFDGNALDSSGNGIDGTETGGVSNATGWLNGAYEFDGSTGYIDLGNTLLVDNELTISAWAYADSLPKSYNAILGKWHSPSQIWESYNVMVQPTGAVEIGLTGGQEGEGGTGTWIYCSTTDTPFSTNAWHIVTATWKYSAGTCADMHIYVDGVEHTNGGPHNGNLASITATGPAYIGLGPGLGVSYWDGKIDNAVIYNRSLSASEVEENYLHGAATRDYSGNGNNGTSYGASWNSSGKFGGALSFDGTNDYVDAGNGAGLQLTDADFAIEVWVKFDATPVITFIFAKGTTTPPNYEGYLLAWAYGAFYNVNGNAANTIGGGCPAWSPTLGNWYHVVFTGNGTVAKTYLDGIEVCSNSYSAGYPANTAHNLMFATREDHFSYFDGLIDNAVIYNRSLSAAEVLNHYYLGAGPTHGTFEKTWDAGANVTWGWFNWNTPVAYQQETAVNGSEQVGYWKFNNDSNYGENDTHAFDYSGNGNNGTNVGATWTPSGKFGGALSFDGTGDNYVDVGTDASLELGAAFAVEAWIKPIVLGTYSGIVSKDSPGRVSDPYSWMFVCHNDGTIGSYTGYPGGWSFSSNAGITAGNWYHVAWVVNGGSVYYYVNGVNYGSAGFGYSVVDSNIVYIGSWLAGEPTFAFKGIIDNVAIYNRALSAGEVLDHYKAGALNLAMQVAASTDNFIWSDWANYSASQSSGFLLNFNGGRYLKYKAAFSTENADYSPMLSDAFAAYAPEETSFVAINIKAGFQTINFTHMNAYGTYHTLSDSKTWTAEADFNSGSPANVTVTGYADGEIQLSGTNSTGSFTSSPFGSGLLVNWQEINWTAPVAYGQETPANGSEQVGYWKFNENSETPYNQSGAIGWWRFNNASAYGESDSLAFDYSGNGNNGTINGAAYVDGKFSKALDFDGTDDYVDYGDACDLTGSFAIEAWIKTSQTGGMIITKIKENTAWNYQINVDGSGHLQAYVGGWVTSTGTVNDNRWRHVALVSDGSTGHLYIDGIQDGSGAISPTANNYPLYVGAYESLGGGVGGFFDGTIDDIIIYNRGLSADEIREDYLRGAGTRDYSGNGNNGTNHGASWTSGGEFGGALDFDGSTSYVTVPDSAAFDFGSGDFAIETWIYPTAEPAVMGEIINKAAASSYSPWRILRANGGEIQWYMANATPLWTAYANTGLYAPLNTWTHIAMARTSGTVTVYVNGVASTPASANFALYNPTVDVCLGRLCLHGTPYYFQGLMDNAIIYNRSLSAGEVLNHYEAGILDLTMQSRYGNTSSPDGTWSGWYSHGNQAGSGIGVQSHYMQWKAVFSTEKAGYSPVLNDTAVSFASAAAPIIVENEGTVAANVSIYASDMFYSAPNPSQRYLFRVSDYEPGSIGEGSATEWTEMPSAGAPVVAVASLGYSPSANEARIDVKVVVPSDEPPGQKNSTVILSASQA